MLRSAIDQCPDNLWVSRDYPNPYWRIAYHILYFLHLYIQPKVEDFQAWEKHQTFLQDLDDIPAPPELQDLVELPHRPPQTGVPLTKAEIIEYWTFCSDRIDTWIDKLDLASPESGFYWYRISKVEHQLVAIRHLQHHAAQLGDRLRREADLGIEWVGAKGRRQGG